MGDEFDDISALYLFISSVSTKCVSPEKYVRARPKQIAERFPITIVRLDTKEIRNNFFNHPRHPIKSVPSLAAIYTDDRVDVHTSIVRVIKFMEKYDRYCYNILHEEYQDQMRMQQESEEYQPPASTYVEPQVISEDPEELPPPPPSKTRSKKSDESSHPKMLQSEVGDLLKHPLVESNRIIISDDIEPEGESAIESETPPIPNSKGFKFDNNSNKKSMTSLIEQARRMEEMAKKTSPGLDDKRYPTYN